MITDDSFFYLPNLYTFQNGNAFYGSFRGLRFYIVPTEQAEEKIFDCKVWYGEYCLEESEIVDTAAFSMDEDGYSQVLTWLEEQYNRMKNSIKFETTGV